MITFPCPACGRKLRTAADQAGKKTRCPACAAVFYIPQAGRPDSSAVGEQAIVPPAAARAEPVTTPPTAALSAAHSDEEVPGYEILGELGRGGMGVVYLARQAKLNRQVALKMILSGGHAGDADLARFKTEAEAIARLQHPNIVQIYEVGECEGRPFFSLEFCGGGSLERKLAGTPLPPREAARLVETLARAMQSAHDARVIHRDLKPANVLLTVDGSPKITDFGLARKIDEAGQTASNAVMGTPSYMAPEQAGGKVKELGPAADVYSLGAILYECLTGRPPFRAATALDTLMQVVADEPVPPRQLQSKVPRDLETICLKCLSKEPAKRYSRALDLAEDLWRFQAGDPIGARPVGRMERLAKWVRRRPAAAALLAVSTTALVALIILLDASRRQADERSRTEIALRRDADEAKTSLAEQQEETRRQLDRTRRLLIGGQIGRAAALVKDESTCSLALALLRDRDVCPVELRDFAWGYYHRLANRECGTLKGHAGEISALRVSPDGRTIASAGPEGKDVIKVWLWDVATAKARRSITLPGRLIRGLTFSPDGKLLALAVDVIRKSQSRIIFTREVTLWKVDEAGQPRTLSAAPAPRALAFTADGAFLTAAGEDVKVWAVASGEVHQSWKIPPIQEKDSSGRPMQTFASLRVAFSADGRRVATWTGVSKDGSVPEKYPIRVYDVLTSTQVRAVPVPKNYAHFNFALSPNGDSLTVSSVSQPSTLWDLRKPDSHPQTLPFSAGRHLPPIPDSTNSQIQFTPDGKGILVADLRGANVIKLHDALTGRLVAVFDSGTRNIVYPVSPTFLAVTPDGRTLVATLYSSSDVKGPDGIRRDSPGVIHLWSLAPPVPRDDFSISGEAVGDRVVLMPNGKELLSQSRKPPRIDRWSLESGKLLSHLSLGDGEKVFLGSTVSPDGECFVTRIPASSACRIQSTRTGQEIARLSVQNAGLPVAFRPDSRALAFLTFTEESTPGTNRVSANTSRTENCAHADICQYIPNKAISPGSHDWAVDSPLQGSAADWSVPFVAA